MNFTLPTLVVKISSKITFRCFLFTVTMKSEKLRPNSEKMNFNELVL